MANILDSVKTIILVMMENRSFDHMLGHMTLDDPRIDLEGLKSGDMESYANDYLGSTYPVYPLTPDQELEADLPHEYDAVATQMQWKEIQNVFTMHGFAEAYIKANSKIDPKNLQCIPMGYFEKEKVPITNFFAQNFAVCDHWFSPLPTSTQPNRTMALCGDSPIFRTQTQLINIGGNIFDWMNSNRIRWRVYHDGFSFYTLYPKLWPEVLGGNFKRFETFYADQMKTPGADDPQVIIIEPSYQDAPHFGAKHPNDNHAPLAIGFGEDFLRQVYMGLTANPERWAQSVMVLYYDEHGGFFDHVAPPAIPYTTTGSPDEKFQSLGPRVPGIVISPLVKPGLVFKKTLDHTSVLQLLADKFTRTKPFSETVQNRKNAGIHSLSELLGLPASFNIPKVPTVQIKVQTALGKYIPTTSQGDMKKSFSNAAIEMMYQRPDAIKVYPELVAWKDIQDKANPV